MNLLKKCLNLLFYDSKEIKLNLKNVFNNYKYFDIGNYD